MDKVIVNADLRSRQCNLLQPGALVETKEKVMSSAIQVPPPHAPAVDAPYDLTIDLVSRMVETGLIPRDRRIYLQDGRLYEKMAKTKAHGYVWSAVNMAVALRLPEGWSLWPESTIVLDPTNAPLPDFAVVRGASPLDFAAPERYPGPGDIGLLIEIAVTSLRADLTTALEQYARAAIPAYWVVDVPGRRVVVHTEPRVVEGRGEYARIETYRPGQALPLILDGQEVARIPFDALLR
jgi:Uma2 family endonuclease